LNSIIYRLARFKGAKILIFLRGYGITLAKGKHILVLANNIDEIRAMILPKLKIQ